MKRLAAAIVIVLAACSTSHAQVFMFAHPAVPVAPASVVAVPQAIVLPTYQPVVTYRWGIFGRRIVPRVHWVPQAPITYVPITLTP